MIGAKLQSAARAYDSFWFGQVSVDPLVVGRIGLGASMLAAYLLYIPYIDDLFGPEGLGDYMLGSKHFIRHHTWTVWWITVISAFCFMVGLGTRLSGALLIFCHLAFIEPGRFFNWGWLPTVPAFLAYLSLGPSNARLSVDSWIKNRLFNIAPKDEVPAWCQRLIQIHIIAIYLGAGWHRIGDGAWIRGEMVYEAVTYAYFSRFPGVDWSLFKLPLAIANYVAWGLELAAPVGLVVRKTRVWFALGLWGMHAGLEATSTVGWWQLMMMSVLFTYLPVSWSQVLLRPLEKLFRAERGKGGRTEESHEAAQAESAGAPAVERPRPDSENGHNETCVHGSASTAPVGRPECRDS